MNAPSTSPAAALLAAAAGFGLSAAASSAAPAFAAADGALAKKKLIVVICRGGMDGLSVAPPVGDPRLPRPARRTLAHRPTDGPEARRDLRPAPELAAVHALAKAGEARIVPAVATPDRARSHFEAQDVLETGAAGVYATTSGWLNRTRRGAVGARARSRPSRSGRTAPLILRGKVAGRLLVAGRRTVDADGAPADHAAGPLHATTRCWARRWPAASPPRPWPRTPRPAMARRARPPMTAGASRPARRRARQGREAAAKTLAPVAGRLHARAGRAADRRHLAGRLRHPRQPGRGQGQLATRLAYLDAVLDGLHTGLGPEWKNTVVRGRHRVRPHRAGQRHRRHRPRHGLDGAAARRRAEARRHRRRLADPEAERAVREPRPGARRWTCAACSRACWPSTWASTARALDTTVFPDSAAASGRCGPRLGDYVGTASKAIVIRASSVVNGTVPCHM